MEKSRISKISFGFQDEMKIHFQLWIFINLCLRYWLEQLIFHLVQSFPSGPLPSSTSNIFNFPDDLLKPDAIFYLNIPDDLQLKGMTTRSPINFWKPR